MLNVAHGHPGRLLPPPLPAVNRYAVSAAVQVLLVYLFAGLPIQIGVLTQLDVPPTDVVSWFFITWLTTGLTSLGLALFTRQPASVNLSVPVLVFLAGAAGGFSLPEILGANLAVGIVAVVLSMLSLNDAFVRLVPGPVAIGVFAGSVLAFLWKASALALTDPWISGPVMIGFAFGLAITRSQLISVSSAVALGLVAVLASGADIVPDAWASLPTVSVQTIEFDPGAITALSVPILILTLGIGNVQGLAVLRSQGYRPKGNLVGLLVGATTIVNAIGGGHAAGMSANVSIIAVGPSAGPQESRFWAVLLSSIPVVAIAFLAVPVIGVAQSLPLTFMLPIGALTLAAPFVAVSKKIWNGPMRPEAVTAFVVAALPFQAAGLPMAFWALVAGIAVTAALRLARLAWQSRLRPHNSVINTHIGPLPTG